MPLIEYCLCGDGSFRFLEMGEVEIGICSACGIGHQLTELTQAQYQAQYFGGDYHRSSTRHPGCTPYLDRYEHDFAIAGMRWKRYGEILGASRGELKTALDVGAANGAFVDFLHTQGLAAQGVDPDPLMTREAIRCGTVLDFEGEVFDLVTYHDVLEHIVWPAFDLQVVVDLLAPAGVVILDVPDIFDGHGDHHCKAEHLWYFHAEGLRQLCDRVGLSVFHFDKPIPGKLVCYAKPSA